MEAVFLFSITFASLSPGDFHSSPDQARVDRIIDLGVQIVSTIGGLQIAGLAIAFSLKAELRGFASAFAISVGTALSNLGLALFMSVCGCPPGLELKLIASLYAASTGVFLLTTYFAFRAFARAAKIVEELDALGKGV